MGEFDHKPVNIPPDKLDLVYRLVTPEIYYEGGVHDFIMPIVAEAILTDSDGKETTVLVRDCGKNPAVVTLDGRTYFYARNDPEAVAGATKLLRLVSSLADTRRE
jgi:hypothetical protein